MNTTQQALTRNKTLPSNPDLSLFKYKLFWGQLSNTEQQPKILYSFDRQNERELFRAGLPFELRNKWVAFLNAIPDDAYSLLGLSYPTVIEQDNTHWLIEILIEDTPSNQEHLKTLLNKYAQSREIGNIAYGVGLRIRKISPISVHVSKLPRIGYSPRYHQDYLALQGGGSLTLNGLTYVKTWFDRNFANNPNLLNIEVYDNLCYHQDNHMTTWHYRNQPQNAASDTQTSRQPRTHSGVIGDLIPQFLQ